MESLKTKAAHLKDHLKEFTDTSVQLAKAKATKGAANAASGIAIGLASVVLGYFFLLFLFIGIAWWLGSLFNSPALGFLTVAGFFLLILVIIFALRKKVIVPMIRNTIVKKVYEKSN